ncbi:hypothetical protein CR513_15635 [Mucuna pruriens]|uniref:Uncharacterized protein n=1 Tax=Mucuna pruriens TaxID=157652 RepID=A0A371HE89_MUCPR|nr:hypothetical protein CR513_15635 [Mucuna pruriens]
MMRVSFLLWVHSLKNLLKYMLLTQGWLEGISQECM